MAAIDAVHTLGALEAERQRVLQALADDDLLDRNRSRALPLVPCRVALVTSAGSAAQRDVLHELETSGLGFHVLLADARVQGPEAEGSLEAALAAVAARSDEIDVVVLARGGGSRADLGAFDRERVARAVATMPVPVVAAIGHETDRSVVDRCAHVSVKTPTAGAAWCVERVQRYVDTAEDCWRRIAGHAAARVTATANLVDDRAGRIRWATSARLTRADERVGAAVGRLEATARLRLDHHEARMDDRRARTRDAASRRLLEAAGTVAHTARRTSSLAPRALGDAERRLEALATQIRLLDPAQVLARGWSITRTADGRLVRQPADAPPGTGLVTTTGGGEVRSTVEDG
jgi:exodeoxyribonuclease VII large subunit